jgi:endogenous inhibitor of DNA gyrase (YacG/DUF329 family)
MKCPICRKEVKIDDPEMPFCSERCRMIDLGNWSSEKYVISTPLESPEYINGATLERPSFESPSFESDED